MNRLRSYMYFATSILTIATCNVAAQAQTAPAGSTSADAAEGGLQDIIVTARRREERLQSTPVSITALTAGSLERQRIEQVDKLQNVVPNLATSPMPSALGGGVAFIRGIGSQELLLSVDSPVGTYVDGVYIGRNVIANMGLVAPERIEVLRGPQGTLFGRNTTGGAISITTPKPRDTLGVEAKLGLSSFSERYGQLRVDSGELGDTGLSVTGAYQHRNRHGYVNNPLASGKYDPGALETDAFWAKVHGEWGALTLDYTYDNAKLRGVAMAFQVEYMSPAVRDYYANSPNLGGATLDLSPNRDGHLAQRVLDRQVIKSHGHALTLQFALDDHMTIKSISAYRRYKARQPVAYVTPGLLGVTTVGVAEVYPFQSDENTFRSQKQYSEEFQMLGQYGDVSFVVGGYYFKEKAAEDAPTSFTFLIPPARTTGMNLASATTYAVTGRSTAGFGQASYKPSALGQKLELTAGFRYTVDEKSVSQTKPSVRSDTRTFNNFSYNLTASYQLTPDALTFARVGTGYRSGGFNARAGAGVGFVFAPEKVTTYEVGFKTDWFDRRLRANGAVFYTDYKNLQVPQYTGGAGGGTGFTNNANAHLQGFEFEMQAVPVHGLTFDASAGYVKTVFDQIFFPDPVTGVVTNFASQSHFPYVPKWTAHAGAQYVIGDFAIGQPSVRLDYSWRSKRYFHTNNLPNLNPFNDQIASKAYGLVNGSIMLSQIPLSGNGATAEVSLWAENLLDKEHRVQGVDFGSLGFAGNVYGMPRRIGVDLKIAF